jgi:hypothetical protein
MKVLTVPQSGSMQGTTASHNRAGQYLRSRRSPVQPVGTGRKAAQRANFGAASSGWSGLTDPQRAAWSAYAAGKPVTDALGQSIPLTGQQMFVSINAQLLNCGSAISLVPPISTVVVIPVITVFTVTHLGVITLTLTPSGGALDHILVAFGRPVSAGVSFHKTYWQADVLPGNSVGNATEGTKYQAQFGLPPVGTKVFLKLSPVNQYGVTGVPLMQTVIVI